MASQKRSSVSLICQENKKRRKVHKPEVLTAEGKGNVDKYDDTKLSERDEFLKSELQRVSRSEQIMKNLLKALWAVSKQKLLESESAAKSMKELLSEKDIQIIELNKQLNHLKSCSNENDFHLGTELVVEEVSEEITCYDSEKSSANSDTKGKLVDCDTSVTNSIDEQELNSRYLKTQDAFGRKCNVEKESTETMVQVVDKKLNNSESFSEQTSVHDCGVTHAISHLDHSSDRSYTEHHILPCIKSEHASLFPHGCGKKAPMEQSEEELSRVENSEHDVDIKEVKHHDCPSSSQEVNSGTEAISSNQAFVDLQGMGAVQKNPEEPESVSGRCEPTVEMVSEEYGTVCGQRPDVTNGRGGMFPRVLNERPPQIKGSTAPTKDCHLAEGTADEKENCPAQVITGKKEDRQAEGITDKDKKEELCASEPSKTKKSTRRLLPVSTMMLKEFTGPNMDASTDTKRVADAGVKSSVEAAAGGRSEKLIWLLKARTVTKHHHRS